MISSNSQYVIQNAQYKFVGNACSSSSNNRFSFQQIQYHRDFQAQENPCHLGCLGPQAAYLQALVAVGHLQSIWSLAVHHPLSSHASMVVECEVWLCQHCTTQMLDNLPSQCAFSEHLRWEGGDSYHLHCMQIGVYLSLDCIFVKTCHTAGCWYQRYVTHHTVSMWTSQAAVQCHLQWYWFFQVPRMFVHTRYVLVGLLVHFFSLSDKRTRGVTATVGMNGGKCRAEILSNVIDHLLDVNQSPLIPSTSIE